METLLGTRHSEYKFTKSSELYNEIGYLLLTVKKKKEAQRDKTTHPESSSYEVAEPGLQAKKSNFRVSVPNCYPIQCCPLGDVNKAEYGDGTAGIPKYPTDIHFDCYH